MGFPKPMQFANSRNEKISFMKKMEWNLMGTEEISEKEMKSIEGGLAALWWAVLWSAVSNFGDIREGISDGINGKPPRY